MLDLLGPNMVGLVNMLLAPGPNVCHMNPLLTQSSLGFDRKLRQKDDPLAPKREWIIGLKGSKLQVRECTSEINVLIINLDGA